MNDKHLAADRRWEAWEGLCEAGQLRSRDPREIVAACRAMVDPEDGRLRGKLLEHLHGIARIYLRGKVRRDLLDGGGEIIEEVVEKLNEALLDPSAKDGMGFEKAFYKKLRQRLGDRLRLSLREKDWVEQEAVDEETGLAIESPDMARISPEDLVIVGDLIERLPPLQRQAFALHLKGFKYTSSDPDESISEMLGKTPKTIQKWVEGIRTEIMEMLGAKK